MKFRKCKEQSTCAKTVSKRIRLPCRPLDSKMFKKPWCKIRDQIASGTSLYKNACQVGTNIIIVKIKEEPSYGHI